MPFVAYYEKRGDAWRAQIRLKGYPTLSATFDTKAEAQRSAAELEGDTSSARFVEVREAEVIQQSAAENRVFQHPQVVHFRLMGNLFRESLNAA
ncbi:Site-specific recombinase, phage integrase family [Pseudomonas caricapapayae]|nr:Site-specific recombinase, phage integrase family [Pseudomonas caricapapayae]